MRLAGTRGNALGHLEGYYDQRITQRLVLQPRAEGVGSGLVDVEARLRLRYELVRELVPYIGVSWERKFGETARLHRLAGEGVGGFRFVAGIRAWL